MIDFFCNSHEVNKFCYFVYLLLVVVLTSVYMYSVLLTSYFAPSL